MKYIRKSISIILIASILALIPFHVAGAASNIIYQTSATETVTSGATLEKITRFTNEGWLGINVLRVDLSNPNVKVDTLSNLNSIQKLTTVRDLASASGAIAGINANFFNWMGDAGSGYPDGPVVESGKVISASSEYNRYSDSMASFSLSNSNQALYNYWKTDMKLIAPNGYELPIKQYNKVSTDYNDFTIIDKRWSSTSMGVSDKYPDITEIVVDNSTITDIRLSQPAVDIPQNGYVVVTRQSTLQTIMDNFHVGDYLGLSITTTPDWTTLKTAVTGSAILVKDGKIPDKFSVNISGRHPRTAIGSNKDGGQLIMVTVDGRQNSSIGMTQTELAQLMIELGAYNALNFDGGGSTTMVSRALGTNNLKVVNKVSDGSERGVSTGVGLFSIAPVSPLDGMIINTEDTNIFVNTSRDFSLRGYDRYFNPVDVDPNQVNWSVSGVQGSFTGSTFYPKSTGEGKIKATVGNISTEINISVLSSPVQIKLNTKTLKLPLNSTKTFTVTASNKNGYTANINPKDVNWSVSGNIGSFNGNVFTATTSGTGYIDASIDKTHVYCSVSVATSTPTIKDEFETVNGTFLASPASLAGNFEISTEQKHSGNSSGKLTYDFTSTEGTRAAYMVFSNGGLPIDPNTAKLGLWVYSDHTSPNWLRAEVYDSNGSKTMVDFTRNIDWTGWKYIESSLQDVSSPATVTRLYIVQPNPVSDSGSVYFDDLATLTSAYPTIDSSTIPQDTVYIDPDSAAASYQESNDSFRFGVFGQSTEPKNLLEKLFTTRLLDKVNTTLDAAAFVGNSTHQITTSVKKPFIAVNTGYKVQDIKNSRFIQLDTSKKGLRQTNAAQWNWFFNQLNSFSGSNIFIFMTTPPKSFSDNLEGKLFQDTLYEYKKKNNKNVWVFYQGDGNTSTMENGIKYISTTGYNINGLTPANAANTVMYTVVTVKGNTLTYEFKPVI